jgi:predicted ATPase
MVLTEDDYRPANVSAAGSRLVVISGCSGGGKSTLLAELGRRGHPIFPEPGRQVVKEELAIEGDALPWAGDDGVRFLQLVLSRALHQMTLAAATGRTSFFDRGVVDAASALESLGAATPATRRALERFRYAPRMFMIPPWPEIFATDAERRHGLEAALPEYERLLGVYAALGHEVVEVPRMSVAERADFVLAHTALEGGVTGGA